MKTVVVEGIGPVELNQTAKLLSSLLKALRIIFFAVFGVMAFVAWAMLRNHETPPLSVSVPALLIVVAAFALWASELLVMHRLYYPGDWYLLLERSASTGKHDYAREAARALLKLTGGDLLTCKLRAKAHLYLAYHLKDESGAARWEPLLALLNSVLEQEPGNADLRLDRAQAYQRVGRYSEALRDLDILVSESAPPSLRASSVRISCLTSLGLLDDARLACDQLEKGKYRFPSQSEVEAALAAHRAQLAGIHGENPPTKIVGERHHG